LKGAYVSRVLAIVQVRVLIVEVSEPSHSLASYVNVTSSLCLIIIWYDVIALPPL